MDRLADLTRHTPWLRTGIGIFGNAAFLIGSVFFLFEDLKRAGVWLFILGAAGMLFDSVVNAALERQQGEAP